MIFETARDLWPVLIARAGLDVPTRQSWVKKLLGPSAARRANWYDLELIEELREKLFPGVAGDFEDLLNNTVPHVQADRLVRALFQSLQPFSLMKQDILAMMSSAGARKGDQNIRIRFDFERLDSPLELLLNEFREQMEFLETRTRAVPSVEWDPTRLWDLVRIPKNAPEWPEGGLRGSFGPQHQAIGDWIERVWAHHDFPPFPDTWRTGHSELDDRLQRVVGVLSDMLAAYRRYGADYEELRSISGRRGPIMDSIGISVSQLSQIESDFWSASVGEWVLKVLQAEATYGPGSRLIRSIIEGVDEVLPATGVSEIQELFRSLLDVLNLPIWKKRNEVYAVWIGTQIWRALSDQWDFLFHVENGVLSFSFSGVHLATLLNRDRRVVLTWWTELRTMAENLPSGYRSQAIQPDYRILKPPFTGMGTDVLVLEVKQYMRGGTANFAAALQDYVHACPSAAVLLANYGPISGKVFELAAAESRADVFEQVRPDRPDNCELLRQAIDTAVARSAVEETGLTGTSVSGAIGRIELRWKAKPSDLDLHLIGHFEEQEAPVHVSYRDPSHGTEITFDKDVTTGHGPEVITLDGAQGTFVICVHRYSNDGTLADAEALVDLFLDKSGHRRVVAFCCPKQSDGNERWWIVCEIDAGVGSIRGINMLVPSVVQ